MNTEKKVTKPTIIYFSLAGRAEIARLLLELADVSYDYHSISYSGSPGENWEEYKKAHAHDLPFGQLPLYKEPGVSIVQSHTIVRYLAKKHGFNGSNEHEAITIDALYEAGRDLITAYYMAKYAEESQRAAKLEKCVNEEVPKHLGQWETILQRNHGGHGYFVGDRISYADVLIFWIVKLVSETPGGKEAIEGFPAIAGFLERVSNLPNIKRYFASDPYKA